MRLKVLATAFIFLLATATGCAAHKGSGNPEARAEGLRQVIYPPAGLNKFPQNQVIKKELQVTTQWQTVTFKKPLQINRKGTMGLHLVVDQTPYISTTDDDPRNLDCSDAEYQLNAFSLRRRSDWALVRPEAILVGDNGEEVKVRPISHLYPSFDKHIMTVALGYVKDINAFAPPFPEGIKTFTAMRIRSTTPFVVRYLWWKVDSHPEFFSR